MYVVTRETTVDVIGAADFSTLVNPGVTSLQILWPGNAPGARATVTQVTIAPGGTQPRHSHPQAEQIWIVQRGRGELLLEGSESRPLRAGEVVRTPAGEIHGLHNTGAEPFVYLAITTPPVDFTPAYEIVR